VDIYMVFSLYKLKQRIIFVLQLILLTLIMYYVIHLLQGWMEPTLRYKEPVGGHSIKVFQREAIIDQHQSIKQQLSLFYWTGE